MRIKTREGSSPKEIVFMGEKKGKRYLKDSHDSRSLFAARNSSRFPNTYKYVALRVRAHEKGKKIIREEGLDL